MRHFLSTILLPLITISAVLIPIASTYLLTRSKSDVEQAPLDYVPTFTQIEITSPANLSAEEKQFLEIPEELATFIKGIQKNSNTILEIQLTTDQIALLSADRESQPTQLKRLLVILQGFQFETIEEKIVEIDVRYKLPVLRTNKSSEQVRSEFQEVSDTALDR